jgi:hypothetical protein
MNTKINHNKNKERLTGFEKNSVIIFRIIGLLFFALTFVYFFDNDGDAIQRIGRMLSSKSTIRQKNTDFSWEIFYELLTYYIPIITGILFCIYTFKKKKTFSYYLSVFLIFAAIFFSTNTFISNWIKNYLFCYSNYYIASAFLVIPTTLFLINYYKHKKEFLLTLTSIYFYIFLFQLLIIRFSYTYVYVFTSIIIYNSIVGILSKKENSFLNNWINFLSANFFLIIYIIRQLYFNHKKESLTLFFITSLAFIIVFLTIGLLKKSTNKRSNLIYLVINNIFFISSNIIVLLLFSYKEYLFIPLLIGLTLNSLVIFIIIKFNHHKEKTESFEFMILFLIALFVATLSYIHNLQLFLGSLAILLTIYFKYNKKNYFILNVIIPTLILIINLAIAIGSFNNNSTTFNAVFFKKELICFIISICSAFVVKKIVNKDLKINIPIKKRIYYDFLEAIFIANIIIFITWILYRIELITTGNTIYYFRILKIIIMLAGLYLLNYADFISIKLTKSIHYTLLVFCVIAPIIEFSQFPYNDSEFLNNVNFLLYESILHYVSLIVYAILFLQLISYFKKINIKRNKLQLFIESISIIAILLIICKEYDWLTILFSKTLTPEKIANLISYNSILAYSYIILISTMLVFLLGVINRNKPLRIISLLINFLIIAKVLFFDFKVLTKNEKLILLLIIGSLFILISLLYNKIKARRKKRKIILQ